MENGSLGLVFQYFFTIGVAVGFGLGVGVGIPTLIILKIRGAKWKLLNRNKPINR
jgi:hypothetical protein